MNIAGDIAIAKDVVVALAAIATAGVAVVGLQKWRAELRGKAHFDAARNLIRATYRLRDELQRCRSPFVHAAEFPANYPPKTPDARIEANAWADVYEGRFAPVREALRDFEATALEAEALWGDDIRKPAIRLRGCVVSIRRSIEADINDKLAGGEHFRRNPGIGREIRMEVQAATIGTDPFSEGIAADVAELEAKLRMHLGR